MKPGIILSIIIFIFCGISFYGDYMYFRHTDNDEYSWIMYCEFFPLLSIPGLLQHKKWGYIFMKVILWMSVIGIFFFGFIAANLAGAKGVFEGMIGSLKLHWIQFVLFGSVLFYMNMPKVKEVFRIK